MKHRLIIIERDGRLVELDSARTTPVGQARDYMIDAIRALDTVSPLRGLTFYLSTVGTPASLPRYGDDVVLLVVTDEAYQHRSWYADLLCLIRLQPRVPFYLDGIPSTGLHWSSLAHYLYKSAQHLLSVGQQFLRSGRPTGVATRERYLPGPLGPYAPFDPYDEVVDGPVTERRYDLSFMGSVDFRERGRFRLRNLLESPKTVSRRRMAAAMNEAIAKYGFTAYNEETANFDASVSNEQKYLQVMRDTKIALCPRGTICDTYRFFEACKLGCAVICEPLPDTWFYRDHPGITVRDWSELDTLLPQLLHDPARLAEHARCCHRYWRERVDPTAFGRQIARFIEGR
ncbi:MAG: hypothetical protein QM674_18220, partial [Burkholderiaceae bacterium]